jgi:hypothetical protein
VELVYCSDLSNKSWLLLLASRLCGLHGESCLSTFTLHVRLKVVECPPLAMPMAMPDASQIVAQMSLSLVRKAVTKAEAEGERIETSDKFSPFLTQTWAAPYRPSGGPSAQLAHCRSSLCTSKHPCRSSMHPGSVHPSPASVRALRQMPACQTANAQSQSDSAAFSYAAGSAWRPLPHVSPNGAACVRLRHVV